MTVAGNVVIMGALGQRLGQGQAREAGTEKSGVSGISLSRAETRYITVRVAKTADRMIV